MFTATCLLFLIIAFGLVFNAVQANTITGAMTQVFGFVPMYVGIAIVVVSAFVIMGGLRKVAKVSELRSTCCPNKEHLCNHPKDAGH